MMMPNRAASPSKATSADVAEGDRLQRYQYAGDCRNECQKPEPEINEHPPGRQCLLIVHLQRCVIPVLCGAHPRVVHHVRLSSQGSAPFIAYLQELHQLGTQCYGETLGSTYPGQVLNHTAGHTLLTL